MTAPPDEAAVLLAALDRQRARFAWKCGGLDAHGMRATLGPSTITLGGLLKHLARVEDDMFGRMLHGRDPAPPWDTVDWSWDWQSAADDSPEQLHTLWQRFVDRSRAAVDEALAADGLDHPAVGLPDSPSLRVLLIHAIEEYARHLGHADLIRESVDGQVGEDPP